MTDTRSSAEADLAFMRSILQGDGRPKLTMAVCYLAGGVLYGVQCLFHLGQATGLIRWPDLLNLGFVTGISVAFLVILTWAIRRDRKNGDDGTKGPMAGRAWQAALTSTGMANLAVILIFAVGAWRDRDFAVWLYYPAMVFLLQAAAWFVAWSLKKKVWMLATAVGGWLTAVALGLLVRDGIAYLMVCTAATFLLFGAPGWIMWRDARAKGA
jgi:hypothetical protein